MQFLLQPPYSAGKRALLTVLRPQYRAFALNFELRLLQDERASPIYYHVFHRQRGPNRLLQASASPGGEIGRRKGLKILFRASGVRVQVPPRAPVTKFPNPTHSTVF